MGFGKFAQCVLYIDGDRRFRSPFLVPFFAGMCYNGRYEKEKELEEMRINEKREL